MSFHFESVVNVATHHPIGAKEDNGQGQGFGSDPGLKKKKLDPDQNPPAQNDALKRKGYVPRRLFVTALQ